MVHPATTDDSTARFLCEKFQQSFGSAPRLFRAPGRVNLIGEHTDYNDGFVMPAAIGFDTWIAVGARSDRTLHARSIEFGETADFSLDALGGPPKQHWSDFVRGVAAVLQTSGWEISGANLIIHGEVPMGAGLSSSASLEVSLALSLISASGLNIDRLDLAKLCQRAEHEYVGTRCGIMDQFIAVFGEAGHALMLDCRSLKYQPFPVPNDVRLVICNSMVRHNLAAGEYNLRRADCENGVRLMQKRMPQITALRDVTLAELEQFRSELPERIFRRCRHVISENGRVVEAAEALRSNDVGRFGKLMRESHRSLRDDYEVSCQELDLLVEIASGCDGIYGSRMTGGGFGGCTITLANAGAVHGLEEKISQNYKQETGITPSIYICSAAQGGGAWQGANSVH